MHRELIGLDPDLTILIDLDPRIAASRDATVKGVETRFESRGHRFMSEVRGRLLDRAGQEPDRFLLIDGDADPELICDRAVRVILGGGRS